MSNNKVRRIKQEKHMIDLVYMYKWIDHLKGWLPLNRRYKKPCTNKPYQEDYSDVSKEETVRISCPPNRDIYLWREGDEPWTSKINMEQYRGRISCVQTGQNATLVCCSKPQLIPPRKTGKAAHGASSKVISIRAPLDLLARLDEVAKEHNVSRSAVILLALENAI